MRCGGQRGAQGRSSLRCGYRDRYPGSPAFRSVPKLGGGMWNSRGSNPVPLQVSEWAAGAARGGNRRISCHVGRSWVSVQTVQKRVVDMYPGGTLLRPSVHAAPGIRVQGSIPRISSFPHKTWLERPKCTRYPKETGAGGRGGHTFARSVHPQNRTISDHFFRLFRWGSRHHPPAQRAAQWRD